MALPSFQVLVICLRSTRTGLSNGNTDQFRWSPPQWIYNCDTKALGLTTNKCCRLDVYVTSVNAIRLRRRPRPSSSP
jgi:hypothetical protein